MSFLLAAASFAAAPLARAQQTTAEGVKLVKAFYAQRRYQDAARVAERLVREHRDDPDAWMALANIHLAPDWAFRHDARAEVAAEKALKLAGRRTDVLATLATAKCRQTKYDEALPLIAELVDSVPPKVGGDALTDLLAMRADVALRRESVDPEARGRALADLDRAIAAVPANSTVRAMRAEARLQDGRLEEALADLLVAQRTMPGSKQVQYLLQSCLARLGRRDEARRHFEIWKRLNRLTDSQGITSAPELPERRQLLRELKELHPADLEHRLQLAQVELELRDPDAAIAECDELLKLAPEWPVALYLRGEAQKAKAAGR